MVVCLCWVAGWYSELTAFSSISTASRLIYSCAHPHEETDGTVYHVMTSVGLQSRYNIVQVPPVQRANQIKTETPLEGAKIVATIKPHKRIAYYHSFGITPNYFIFVENPFSINTFEVLRMRFGQSCFRNCMHWDPKETSRQEYCLLSFFPPNTIRVFNTIYWRVGVVV